jgi:hypothetical protein
MRAMFWLLILAALAAGAVWLWQARKRWQERRRAGEERFAAFMADALKHAKPKELTDPAPPPPPEVPSGLTQQKLLFDAAAKAGEAGEPALAVQLYERLLERYPQTAFAERARAAAEKQKEKLADN